MDATTTRLIRARAASRVAAPTRPTHHSLRSPFRWGRTTLQQRFPHQPHSWVVGSGRYIVRAKSSLNDGLNPGGVLLLVEKVLAESSIFNRDFIKYYYNYKRRNHYSELEISQKREALENVLIPYKLSENMLLLKEAGFADCEIFFKWYNFSGMIAYKKS